MIGLLSPPAPFLSLGQIFCAVVFLGCWTRSLFRRLFPSFLPLSSSLSPGSLQAIDAMSVVGAVVSYMYVMEDWAPSAPRVYSRDLFATICVCLVAVGFAFTVKEERHPVVLAREQTEEWKGWMQIGFLLYHYFHAVETYNIIRVFIAAYVWMTGFGHFSYFWLKQDYSLPRALRMLWRLNFYVTVVCLALRREYMMYYICAMHTLWYLSTWAVMYYDHQRNIRDGFFMKTKLAVFFGVCFVLYDLRWAVDLLSILFAPLEPLLAYNGKGLYEWGFRTGLDHYATLVGMLSAYCYPLFEKWLAETERLPGSARWAAKAGPTAAVAVAMLVWGYLLIPMNKFRYNSWHPYTSMVPVLGWIYLRNLTPWLRGHYLGIFTSIGKITLETYITQFHGWLKRDARSVIAYIPDYPLLTFLLGTAIYLLLAQAVFTATMTLSRHLITDDAVVRRARGRCLATLLVAALAISVPITIFQNGALVWWMVLATGFLSNFAVGLLISADEIPVEEPTTEQAQLLA